MKAIIDVHKWVANTGAKIEAREFAAQWRAKIAENNVILIQRASPEMWYAPLAGTGAPVVVEWVDDDGLWAREPAGHINVIHFSAVDLDQRTPI